MDIFQAVLLGVLQGITEWLPVSSSGHLAVVQHLFGLDVPVLVDIMLHMGTVLAVVAVFRRDILAIFKALARMDIRSENGRLALLIIAALLPTAAIGFAFKNIFEAFFYNMTAIGIGFLITGCFLFVCERWPRKKSVGLKEALLIGTAQGIAIAPGISRSGATIGAGLLAGVDKEKAARFSFLLSVPAIMGAALFDFNGIELASADVLNVFVGVAAAAIVGIFAIKFLLDVIRQQRFRWFAVYCWIMGAAVLLMAAA
jgi:undecaprenyl-diphosphatase